MLVTIVLCLWIAVFWGSLVAAGLYLLWLVGVVIYRGGLSRLWRAMNEDAPAKPRRRGYSAPRRVVSDGCDVDPFPPPNPFRKGSWNYYCAVNGDWDGYAAPSHEPDPYDGSKFL